MNRTKPTSPKQIAANKRNAIKSTGPRTAKGRAVSKMNALKHGILSQQVLVRGRNVQESARDLKALHLRFWDELQPEGPIEEMLLDQIVTAHWRLRRALTAESGEIALSVDTGHRKRSRGVEPVLQWMQWRAFGDPLHAMGESSIGNAIIRGWLGELRNDVEAQGVLTESGIQKLSAHFGVETNRLVQQLDEFRRKLEAEPNRSDSAVQARHKAETLTFLDREIRGLQFALERCVDAEEHEEQARQASAVLPDAATLDKILRYETKLERQMYRAMAQLERIQRMRRGEAIPAPLTLDVSDRG
jgi:hypothetical protein